jgi:hypothetical protein
MRPRPGGGRSVSGQPLRRSDPSAHERRLTSSDGRASSPQYNEVNAANPRLEENSQPHKPRLPYPRASRAVSIELAHGGRRRDMSRTRRLAAILAADCAGYSRLIGTASMATIRHGEIPNGHRWDSLPKVRFATDSAREGQSTANSSRK